MDDEPIFERKVVRNRQQRKRRIWIIAAILVVLLALLFGSQLLGIYVDALWFSSLGYSSVYWYKFRLGGVLFAGFLIATFLILRVAFFLLVLAFPELKQRPGVKFSEIEDLREINILPYLFRPGVWILSIGVALIFAVNMAGSWSEFALYLHSMPAGVRDPIFSKDISFYLFELPVLEDLSGWLSSLAVIILLSAGAATGYLWYRDSLRGFGTGDMARRAVGAISVALGLFALTLAIGTYLSRFSLLTGQHDLFTGIAYTDDHIQLPALAVLAIGLAGAAILLLVNAFALKRGKLIAWAAAGVFAVWLVGTVLLPSAVNSFSVKPNELAKESPYIDDNIKATRDSFGLNRFEERPFVPGADPSPEQLQANRETLDNIRLWDPKILQSTLGQIQEIRQYYDFNVPDIDRYVLNGKMTEVMLAARELNVDKLNIDARNWINQHLVYTHGYGVTMSRVNEFTPEGLPHLVLRDMPVQSDAPELKVTRPEIYFGEETNQHVYVHTIPQKGSAPEFNFPAAGNVDSYNEYQGRGGITVGGVTRKTLLSIYLGDGTNLLFSDFIKSDSRVLLHRNVLDRVQEIAPFLLVDNDPYIVVGDSGRLFWMIDAYTYSSRYPYSTAYQLSDQIDPVNYVRNSVKVVIDAYEGTAQFYVFEPQDPIIKSYESIFPALFHPSSEMPADLARHIRYPNLLMNVQARSYATYHMQSPQILYSHEDLWTIATEDAPAAGQPPAPMRPYYVLMQLPDEAPHLEYVNILPFTPAGTNRTNMIGWMAGRSDAANYGHTLVFTFPKNLLVDGPAQVRARVNQDQNFSQKMTLWNQQGSKLLRGNLLVIPVGNSLLFVEPFFLQAESSPLPELRQVAIATQARLVTDNTFTSAMNGLFPNFAFGQTPPLVAGAATGAAVPSTGGQPPGSTAPGAPASAEKPDPAALAREARQALADYGQLASQGKYQEAGQKLEVLRQKLDELNKASGSK